MFTCVEEKRDLMPPRGKVEKNVIILNIKHDQSFLPSGIQANQDNDNFFQAFGNPGFYVKPE